MCGLKKSIIQIKKFKYFGDSLNIDIFNILLDDLIKIWVSLWYLFNLNKKTLTLRLRCYIKDIIGRFIREYKNIFRIKEDPPLLKLISIF